MAREDHRSRRASSRRDLLSAVRCLSCFAPGSAPGAIGGIPETCGHEIAAADSLDRPDPRRSVDCGTKRQLWAYCGLALRTYDSGEYRFVGGQLKRSKKAATIRGLNKNHNHDLKNIFKGAATRAAAAAGPFQNFYEARIANGMKPPMARLTLARKIAAITLLVWKKGVCFDGEQLKQQAA